MKAYCILLIILWCNCVIVKSQPFRWVNPANENPAIIQGRGWSDGLANTYDRLPAKAERTVRKDVWRLSTNNAGEYIDFETNATAITVRYKVSGNYAMEHMPATGVSGVDMYALDANNTWHWIRATYSFKDTIIYHYKNIYTPAAIKKIRLYLPLYNTLQWLQIGVPEGNTFSFSKPVSQKPLVLYGTSIMQGACASRPGLAWTNILGRKLNLPIINLGFSGNGRLEPELIDLINEQDARLFVLDCQPNLHDRKIYTQAEIEKRIRQSVSALKKQHPETPILLTEHCCGNTKTNIDTSLTNKYTWTSEILNRTFHTLKKEGVKNIYLLTAAEIAFNSESTVDGTHPTDIGMMQYANAYEKKIAQILHPKK